MKLLIITRHGRIDKEAHLSDSGKEQMAELADHLKSLIAERTVHIVSASTDVAKESAQVLAEIFFGSTLGALECLSSGPNRHMDLEAAEKGLLMEAEKADALIVVTDYTYAYNLPSRMTQALIGRAYPEQEITPPRAIGISVEKRTAFLIK